MIQLKLFREDLFYRLNVIVISLPPLSERVDDIPGLIQYFIERNIGNGTVENVVFSQDLIEHLKTYSWPGNIRELENLVERMVVLADSPVISMNSLPVELRSRLNQNSQEAACSFTERSATYEKQLIATALQECGNRQVEAAKLLNMDRSTLRYKMKKYGFL